MNSLWSVTLRLILGIRNLINNCQQWMAGIQTPETISHDYSPTLREQISCYQGGLRRREGFIEDAVRGEKERCYSLSERRSHPAYSPYCFQHIS